MEHDIRDTSRRVHRQCIAFTMSDDQRKVSNAYASESTAAQRAPIRPPIGVALLFVSGWLGGQMVHVYGVGVEGRE